MMKKNLVSTWLKCISCGYETSLFEERLFACPMCGSLYDVEHSYLDAPFRTMTDIFDERARVFGNSSDPKIRSGVWRFKEWIMPCLEDSEIITLGEGKAPIVPAGPHLSNWVGPVNLCLILEGMTPTGSFKDFGGTVMTSVAKTAGIKTIGCASTGDTSAMAAAYSSAAGIDCAVILPEGKVTPVQLAQPLVHGAKVITLPGTFDDCMEVVKELVNNGKMFPANSLNPTRVEGHQATVFLLAQFFGWELPDWIALPVGNGSNCSSVGKAMRLMKSLGFSRPTSHILGSQSEAACPLSSSWLKTFAKDHKVTVENWLKHYKPMKVGETSATAARIGNPVSRDKVMREIVASEGRMNIVNEALLNEAVSVCGLDGHFVCPQTGTALAGVKKAVELGEIPRGATVAVVSTANGLKFTESAASNLLQNIISAKDCRTETVADILGL
jgi:threonine synthase